MSVEKVFAEGFSFKRSETAPDFVVGRISVKVNDAIAFLKKSEKDGWVNMQVKKARTGNFYMELDQYDPKGSGGYAEKKESHVDSMSKNDSSSNSSDDLPF